MKETKNIYVSGREELYEKLMELDDTNVGFSAMLAQAAKDYIINSKLRSPQITCDTNTILSWMKGLGDNEFKIWQSKLQGLINITEVMIKDRC